MSRDLLEDIRGAVDKALVDGETLQTFIEDLRPRLVARGWWGRKLMTDPQSGKQRVVQLGSPARLRTIYETNLRTSYMAGRWQRIERSQAAFPYIRYVSVMDGREREQHAAWHGTVLPVNDPWWDTHLPPCGWNCRCDAQPVNDRMIERKGWSIEPPRKFRERDYINKRTGEVTRVEAGIDPGFGYNVGKASLDPLTPSPRPGKAGEDTALTSLSEGYFGRVSAFFSAFGLTGETAARKGTVWNDAAGWPVAISLGLLRLGNGAMMPIGERAARELAVAAQILREPETIALVWVKGANDKAMLVRRYRSALGLVDMGRDFWRWRTGRARGETGLVIWSKDGGALAAYDPSQPRHGKGSRDGGRFRSTGRGAALQSLSGGMSFFATATLGVVDGAAADRAASQGVDIRGRGVRLEHGYGKKTMARHGPGNERRRDQRAITAAELVNAHRVINSAHTFTMEGGRRLPRFMAVANVGTEKHHVVAEISPRNVSIITMYVKK